MTDALRKAGIGLGQKPDSQKLAYFIATASTEELIATRHHLADLIDGSDIWRLKVIENTSYKNKIKKNFHQWTISVQMTTSGITKYGAGRSRSIWRYYKKYKKLAKEFVDGGGKILGKSDRS